MKSEGIILDTIDYKETSKIVHLYTSEGPIGVKALGASSPKKGLLGFTTIGNTVSFVATEANLPTVTEYTIESTVFKIVEDIERVKVFSVMIDVIKGIPEDAPHKNIYPYIKKVMVDILTENPKKLLSIFLVKMLYAFSITPNLKSCICCGKNEAVFLDLMGGGALCKSCSSINNQDELYIFKEYYYDKKEIKDYTACNYDALLSNLKEYYFKYTHISLKLNGIIKK